MTSVRNSRAMISIRMSQHRRDQESVMSHVRYISNTRSLSNVRGLSGTRRMRRALSLIATMFCTG